MTRSVGSRPAPDLRAESPDDLDGTRAGDQAGPGARAGAEAGAAARAGTEPGPGAPAAPGPAVDAAITTPADQFVLAATPSRPRFVPEHGPDLIPGLAVPVSHPVWPVLPPSAPAGSAAPGPVEAPGYGTSADDRDPIGAGGAAHGGVPGAADRGFGPDDDAGHPDAALTEALDQALDQLDRVGEGADPAAAGHRRSTRERVDQDQRDRRARLKSVLGGVGSLVRAERAQRATQATLIAAQAGELAQRTAQVEELQSRSRAQHPFRVGFFGGLGLLLAYITYLSLDTIRGTLIVISIATVFAIGLDPAVGFLMRRRLRRGWAVTVVFLGLLAVLGGALYAIVPPIVTQVASFITSLPTLISDLQNNATIKNLDEKFHILQQLQNSELIQKLGSGAAGGLLSAGATVAGIAADLLVVLVLTLFFLAGFPQIKAAAFRLAPASRRTRVTDIGDKILKQMGGYLAGATLVAFQAGVLAGGFAAIAGLPYPWAIALGAAVLDFIPVVGPIIIGLSMCLLGFTHSLTVGIIAAAFYICQHLFEAYWLYPRVMRRQVDISTGAVVVAILVGGALLGVTGALLAVPVAAAVQLIVREVVMPLQERN